MTFKLQASVNFHIVCFADEHVAQVAAIEAASYPDPWSEHSFLELRAPGDTSWVVMAEGKVAGYLITQWVLDEIHILNIAVKDNHRRRGIASSLMTKLVTLAVQRGMKDIFLEVRVSNHAAQNAYRKFGFSVLATRERYYPDGEDALVMYRRLGDVQEAPASVTHENRGDVDGD